MKHFTCRFFHRICDKDDISPSIYVSYHEISENTGHFWTFSCRNSAAQRNTTRFRIGHIERSTPSSQLTGELNIKSIVLSDRLSGCIKSKLELEIVVDVVRTGWRRRISNLRSRHGINLSGLCRLVTCHNPQQRTHTHQGACRADRKP